MGAADDDAHLIICRLDELLLERGMTLAQLAKLVDMSVVNLSILKNNRGRAIRFSTLTRLCQVLQCRPGDLFDISVDTQTR